jgi:MoxR-like ATPase
MLGRRNVYLIGPMGSGKTAVGRRLAALLGREFFDSDAEIEKRTGVDVRYIFEKEGERLASAARGHSRDHRARRSCHGRGVILDSPIRAARQHGHRRVSRDEIGRWRRTKAAKAGAPDV